MVGYTGANGSLGTMIGEELECLGVNHISMSRQPERIAHAPCRECRRADYDDVVGLTQAFREIDRLFLMSMPDAPELRVRRHRNAIHAAREAGVKHIIFLSVADAEEDSPFPFAVANRDAETVLREGKLDWTILRPNLYADAILRMSLGGVEERRLVLPWHTGRVAYVARRDIAEVAARLLAGGGFVGESLSITGAKSMTLADVGEALFQASGQSWTNSPTDMETYEEGLLERFPVDTVQAYMGLCRGLEAGRLSETSDTVERICDRKPTPLETVLEEQLAAW
ncbi:MAG: NAD(P)H-binding protein [Myxococcota bacterium]